MTLDDALSKHYEAERAAAKAAGDTRTEDEKTFATTTAAQLGDMQASRRHGMGLTDA